MFLYVWQNIRNLLFWWEIFFASGAYEQEEDDFSMDFSDPESVSDALQDDRVQAELTEDEKEIFNKISKGRSFCLKLLSKPRIF